MDYLKKNKKVCFIILVCVFIIGIFGLVYFSKKDGEVIDLSQTSYLAENDNQNKENQSNNEEKEATICVHIIGEVNNEGIISLKEGQRVIDAIEKAGGMTEKADLKKINLAYILSDGQKIRIPSFNEEEENVQYITNGDEKSVVEDGVSTNNSKVNINTASQTELETLDGIGPSIAAKIIEYRNKNGKFKKVEDLLNVSGIG